ncbi:MAG: Hsp70 family protein [Anaerolineae bacterium]|nr:Hsp70 family protein [Anaerolineae bacterium]
MAGRLGIDFGTSNTVVAHWDAQQKLSIPISIPEYSAISRITQEDVAIIPSLIHYEIDGRIWIGDQVIKKDLVRSNQTFRWMKRYISNRSPVRVGINGKEITPYQAGEDFLSAVLVSAAQEIDLANEEVGFSVPVEAYEHYENWLVTVAEKAGMPRFRLIDEPSAAALGYGAHIQPGNVYLIFDFGGGTMHASVILIESEQSAATGRRCRVLGKAGKDIGGTTIDQWIFQDILKRNRLYDSDPMVRNFSTHLIVECQRIKEELSKAPVSALHLETGNANYPAIDCTYTTTELEALLDENELYTAINQLIRSSLSIAAERGYREENIQAVLMVGGSSQIPSVQRTLRQQFGRDRVMTDRPLDAVARGAAAFVAGIDFYDHIQHDYAVRFINPDKGGYDYKIVVQKGTVYPTPQPVTRLIAKASYDGQQQLGLAIFEMGEQVARTQLTTELVFDPSGSARLSYVTPQAQEDRSLFWMNEHSPTFLPANPPAVQGEARFEVEFNIDYNKRLTVTARDIQTGQLIYNDYPVVKLI